MNPVNENAFVDESVKSNKPKPIDASTYIDISFICDYFHIGDSCRISPVLYDKLIRPYESRKKKIVTDIIFDYEIIKRETAKKPLEAGIRFKQRIFKGMYFMGDHFWDFDYIPWNYLDHCPLPMINIAFASQKIISPEKKETRHVLICTEADCRRGFNFSKM